MHDDDYRDPDTGKPEIILDYNSTKGGVDTVDQLCATLSTARITRRWPVVIFYRGLDIAGINAQKIYFSNNPDRQRRRKNFIKNFALQRLR